MAARQSNLILRIAPVVSKMPLPVRVYDEPFFPFGKRIVDATQDYVVGYMFDMANYLAIGAAGAIALERTLSYVADGSMTIIHGPFTSGAFSSLTDETAFVADAVTLMSGSHVPAFLSRSDRTVFLTDRDQADLPGTGVYATRANRLLIKAEDGTHIDLCVVGDEVVYADSGEQFTQAIVDQLIRLKEQEVNE